jgi:rare lipoprotein A (peptidoglycan hydrolase)
MKRSAGWWAGDPVGRPLAARRVGKHALLCVQFAQRAARRSIRGAASALREDPSMPRLRLVFLAAILTFAGCTPAAEEDEVADEESAQTDGSAAPVEVGSKLKTTANLNLREGPSRSATVKHVMPRGSEVEVLDAEIRDGYVKVRFLENDEEGFAFRIYLRDGAAAETSSAPTEKTGTCKASWYGPGYDGKTTANGETFDQDAMTAARQLAFRNVFPFSPKDKATVRITNLANSKTVDVRINDTGPLKPGRCIDLSKGAFAAIADLDTGVISVKYEPID